MNFKSIIQRFEASNWEPNAPDLAWQRLYGDRPCDLSKMSFKERLDVSKEWRQQTIHLAQEEATRIKREQASTERKSLISQLCEHKRDPKFSSEERTMLNVTERQKQEAEIFEQEQKEFAAYREQQDLSAQQRDATASHKQQEVYAERQDQEIESRRQQQVHERQQQETERLQREQLERSERDEQREQQYKEAQDQRQQQETSRRDEQTLLEKEEHDQEHQQRETQFKERTEVEKQQQEKQDHEIQEQEKHEEERINAVKREQEQVEKQEQEKQEQEKQEQEKQEQEKQEQEKQEQKQEQEKQEQEKQEQEKQEQEKQDKERTQAEEKYKQLQESERLRQQDPRMHSNSVDSLLNRFMDFLEKTKNKDDQARQEISATLDKFDKTINLEKDISFDPNERRLIDEVDRGFDIDRDVENNWSIEDRASDNELNQLFEDLDRDEADHIIPKQGDQNFDRTIDSEHSDKPDRTINSEHSDHSLDVNLEHSEYSDHDDPNRTATVNQAVTRHSIDHGGNRENIEFDKPELEVNRDINSINFDPARNQIDFAPETNINAVLMGSDPHANISHHEKSHVESRIANWERNAFDPDLIKDQTIERNDFDPSDPSNHERDIQSLDQIMQSQVQQNIQTQISQTFGDAQQRPLPSLGESLLKEEKEQVQNRDDNEGERGR